MTLALYFAAGLVLDLIITAWNVAVIDKRAVKSAVLSMFIATLPNLILRDLVLSPDYAGNLAAYAAGCAVGSWWIVRRR